MKALLQFTAYASSTVCALLIAGVIATSTAQADPIPGPGPIIILSCRDCYTCVKDKEKEERHCMYNGDHPSCRNVLTCTCTLDAQNSWICKKLFPQ